MLSTVTVILQEPVAVFELGVLAEIFGVDRSDDGVPAFDFRVCTEAPGKQLSSGNGTSILTHLPLSAAHDADLVALISSPIGRPPSDAVMQTVRDVHDQGAQLLSVCTGVFALAYSGILDGRRVATHWRHAPQLAADHPSIIVDADLLYHQDGPIVSSAGTAAGIDACLHLIRTAYGPAVANRIARRMVVPAHRRGDQRQFVDAPVSLAPDHGLQNVIDWIDSHLADPLTTSDLARVAGVSPRTLVRRFSNEIGSTPHGWLTQRRIARAQELLELNQSSIEAVAASTGFGSAPLLRQHFRRLIGITPTEFRRQFAAEP
ncbi:MAG: helix-turn-helix domain-containing protein [Rhodococcus sp. (in: high G+C Gram-positive bacteria)]